MPFQINQELEDIILEIAEDAKVMALGLTTVQIGLMVKDRLGFEPSKSTIARVLRRLGIDTESKAKKQWTWKEPE